MNIKITKNIEEANAITHSGTFHADETFATIILSKIMTEIKIIRVQELTEEIRNKKRQDSIIYDIGEGKYDHHQFGGNGQRQNGVKYAACGLIWKEFGRKVLEKYDVEDIEYTWNYIDKNLIQFIDSNDNGQLPKLNVPYRNFHISYIVSLFNTSWNEEIDQDEKFMEALQFVKIVFDEFMKDTIAKMKAKKMVEEKILEAEDEILILEKCVPWKEFLLESQIEKAKEIKFVIFPSKRGGYNVYAVPKELGSFENRKSLPKEWRGLRDEALQNITGVNSARFCHNAGFICSAEKKEDAILLAKRANNLI